MIEAANVLVPIMLLSLQPPGQNMGELITLGEEGPVPTVSRRLEEGSFSTPRVSYVVDYQREGVRHRFIIRSNSRQSTIFLNQEQFPNLLVGRMLITADHPSNPELVVSMEYGPPSTGCFSNGEPRNRIVITAGRETRVMAMLYTNCDASAQDFSRHEGVMIER